MMLQSVETPDPDAYENRVILANRIRGLLPCRLLYLNGDTYYSFDITSMQSLEILRGRRILSGDGFSSFFYELIDVLCGLEEYLLDFDHLILTPDKIYIDPSGGKIGLVYFPSFRKDIRESLRELVEYLLTGTDPDDRRTTLLGYRVYHALRKEELLLGELRGLLTESEPETETPERPGKNRFYEKDVIGPSQQKYAEIHSGGDSGVTYSETYRSGSGPVTASYSKAEKVPKLAVIVFLTVGLLSTAITYAFLHLGLGRILAEHSDLIIRIGGACAVILLFAAAFLLPASRTGSSVLYMLAAAVPGVILLLLFLPAGLFSLDRPSLSSALSLCGFGMLAAVYISPDESLSQGMRCIAALFFLAFAVVLVRAFRPSVPSAVLPALCGLGIISCPLWFPSVTFSMAEGGMALLLFAVAAFLSLRQYLPALAASLGGTLLLLLGRDYGSAVVWGLVSVLVFWTGSDSLLWSGISLVSSAGLFGILTGFVLPVSDAAPAMLSRIAAMPLIPPETIVEESAGFGSPESLYFLFGEQYGLILLFCALLLLIALLIRGASLALHTRKSFHASLSLGIVLLLGLRAFLFLSRSRNSARTAVRCGACALRS